LYVLVLQAVELQDEAVLEVLLQGGANPSQPNKDVTRWPGSWALIGTVIQRGKSIVCSQSSLHSSFQGLDRTDH